MRLHPGKSVTGRHCAGLVRPSSYGCSCAASLRIHPRQSLNTWCCRSRRVVPRGGVCFASGANTLRLLSYRPAAARIPRCLRPRSGSLDRNDWTSHPKLREHFARHGIASLVGQARAGASTGDWTRQSFHDRAHETLAAVRLPAGGRTLTTGMSAFGHQPGSGSAPWQPHCRQTRLPHPHLRPRGNDCGAGPLSRGTGCRADGMPEQDIKKRSPLHAPADRTVRNRLIQKLDAARMSGWSALVHRVRPPTQAGDCLRAKNIALRRPTDLGAGEMFLLIVVGPRYHSSVQGKCGDHPRISTKPAIQTSRSRYSPRRSLLLQTRTEAPERCARARVKTFAPTILSTLTDC